MNKLKAIWSIIFCKKFVCFTYDQLPKTSIELTRFDVHGNKDMLSLTKLIAAQNHFENPVLLHSIVINEKNNQYALSRNINVK